MSTVRLRRANAHDALQLHQWRNHPTTRAVSGSIAEIDFFEHCQWFAGLLTDASRALWIGEIDGIATGSVRLDWLKSHPGSALVSVQIDPEQRGKGFGRQILALACDWAKGESAIWQLLARIRRENIASQKIFIGCGFARMAENGLPGQDNGLETWWLDCHNPRIVQSEL